MLQDLSLLESQLVTKINNLRGELSIDCVLPEEFKRKTRQVDNNVINYTEYGFRSSSNLDIYLPNQVWYLAAICVPLYEEIIKYGTEIKDVLCLSKDDIKKCKENKDVAESLIANQGYSDNDKKFLTEFLSNYDWWRGGKTIDRTDYFHSPILATCNLVNATQDYVADMCKFLYLNKDSCQILNDAIKTLPKPQDTWKLLFNSDKATEFLSFCIKEILSYDADMLRVVPSLKINQVTIGFNGFQLGKKKTAQDSVTDSRRFDDCDKDVTWNVKGEEYYLWKEQTLSTIKIFGTNINKVYKEKYKVEIEEVSGTYNLFIKTENNNFGIRTDLDNFKHLLEYFCTHLHYLANNKDTNTPGYDVYLKDYVDKKVFTLSGQGYNNGRIQDQIKKWEQLSCGKVCIAVHPQSVQGKASYLHWNHTSHNISANWNGTKIESLQLFEFNDKVAQGNKRWVTNDIKFTLDDLGLYDGQEPNDNVKTLYEEFMKMLANSSRQAPSNITSPYRPYITAIKSKPFLLLAGISGTGKSRIVRELARACWDETDAEHDAQKPRNFEMVQVKPNWHDSSELFGYVSRVSGTPVYVYGDFLKFIARAWEEPKVPYFLCLDEMNLAPVEQYFAEYLSVIESRKANDNGVITTDPILKKEAEQWYYDLVNELTQTEDIRNRFLKDGICIPQNLIVVGTVNMDETTFSFSRKVLDRAMTIEMNEVNLEGGLTQRYEQIGKLSNAELVGTAVEGVDVYKDNQVVCDKVIAYLKAVNADLEGTPFKIAYRTRNEFLLYVINNLPYNKDANGTDLTQDFLIARALDEITNMKILSRIEGDETKVSPQFLANLEKTIKTHLETISEEKFAKEEATDTFKSVSLAKLDEMKLRLSSGYTSFWS